MFERDGEASEYEMIGAINIKVPSSQRVQKQEPISIDEIQPSNIPQSAIKAEPEDIDADVE